MCCTCKNLIIFFKQHFNLHQALKLQLLSLSADLDSDLFFPFSFSQWGVSAAEKTKSQKTKVYAFHNMPKNIL